MLPRDSHSFTFLSNIGAGAANAELRAADGAVMTFERPLPECDMSGACEHGAARPHPSLWRQARRGADGAGLVFEADLATGEHASHWVLQGVALALNVNF